MIALTRAAVAVLVFGSVLILHVGDVGAQDGCGPEGGLISCELNTESGTVEVGSEGSEGSDGSTVLGVSLPIDGGSNVCDAIPGYGNCPDPNSGDGPGEVNGPPWCVLFPEDEACQPLPEFCDTSAAQSGVCADTGTLCLTAVVDGAPVCDLAAGPPPRPVFIPPTVGEAAQDALDQVVWPSINAGPYLLGGLDWIVGGHIYSLYLDGYESWEPLMASATITQTIIVQGWVFSEDFTATLTATPREVVWDTGLMNDNRIFRHSPPMVMSCDNPGTAGYYGYDDGAFQDWQTYRGYGGPDCEYVFWGSTDIDHDGQPSTISAEVFWDLTLDTSWAGLVGSVGEHDELYETSGWVMDQYSSVGVIRNSQETFSHDWSDD